MLTLAGRSFVDDPGVRKLTVVQGRKQLAAFRVSSAGATESQSSPKRFQGFMLWLGGSFADTRPKVCIMGRGSNGLRPAALLPFLQYLSACAKKTLVILKAMPS